MRRGAVVQATGPVPEGAELTAGNGSGGTVHGHSLRNLPRDELIEDFRLSCLSRALDDREILEARLFRLGDLPASMPDSHRELAEGTGNP